MSERPWRRRVYVLACCNAIILIKYDIWQRLGLFMAPVSLDLGLRAGCCIYQL